MFNHKTRAGIDVDSSNRPRFAGSGAVFRLACAIAASCAALTAFPASAAQFIERNEGQAPASVDFVARTGDYTGLIARDSVLLVKTATTRTPLEAPGADAGSQPADEVRISQTLRHTARMQLLGAATTGPAPVAPESAARSHYLTGNDPDAWLRDVAQVREVRYPAVYPGIDMLYTFEDGQLRYDFIVAPNADPAQIRLAFDGAREVRLDDEAGLQVRFERFAVTNRAPVVYQQSAQGQRRLEGEFVVAPHGEVRFAVADHDPALALIIDPVIEFTSYLGGSGEDLGNGLAAAADGSAWIVGTTDSVDFPVTSGPGTSLAGGMDVFIAHVAADGALLSATYLGGADTDVAHVVALDAAGNPHVAGYTLSDDFPTFAAAQPVYAGAESPIFGTGDGFVTKLNPAGDAVVYSTYLGGVDLASFFLGFEWIRAIKIDDAGNAWVAGETAAPDFPTTTTVNGRGCLQDEAGLRSQFVGDAFVTRFSPTGAIDLSFCFGAGDRDAGRGISIGADGDIYLNGFSRSDDFPTTAGAFQETQASTGLLYDTFVARFDGTTLAPEYATLIGGSDTEFSQESEVGADGSLYLVGVTGSADHPTTPGAFDTTWAGPANSVLGNQFDATVMRLAADGTSLLFSTFLGGAGEDNGWSLALSPAGFVYLASSTESPDFPLVAANQVQRGDVFGVPTDMGTATNDTRAIVASRLFSFTGTDFDMYIAAANDGQNVLHRRADADGSWSSTDLGPASGDSRDIAIGLTGGFFEDIVVANEGSANHLYVNDGNSGFTGPTDIGADNDATRGIAVGSFTGSIDADVVVANYNQPNRLYAGPLGPASVATDLVGAARATTSVAIGDLNGDLLDDIVFGNQDQQNRVYTRNPGGGYGLAANLTADADDTRDIALGDVNGDGRLDIVAGNYNQPNRLYLNDGSGGFPTSTDIGSEINATTSVMFAAVDRDDSLDLIVTGDDTNLIYLNDGSGNFTLAGMVDLAQGAATDLARIDEECADCFPFEYEVFASRAGATNLAYAHEPYDLYIAVLAPDAGSLVYSTYIGGNGDETALWGLDIDNAGNAWIGGTSSSEFLPGAINTNAGGESDAVIVKIALDGDVDGVPDVADNCSVLANIDQRDTDGDGFGNRCDADLDQDDTVNFADLTLLKSAFFSTPGSANWNPDADFDGNDAVDFGDLSIMKALFFQSPGPGATN